MHLVRLLSMGIEVLTTGRLQVYREQDRDFSLAIRNEEYSWNQLFKITTDLFAKLDKAKDKSILPKKVDDEKINNLFFDLICDYYGLN